jgi:FkbM family methyltransferase
MKMVGLARDLLQRVGWDLRRYRPLARDPYVAQQLFLGQSCQCVFDVGAFQGDTVARYATLFPTAEIYAFEPYPPTYQVLADRFRDQPRIHPINAAVSSRNGEATFHVNHQASTNSLLPRPAGGRRYYPCQGAARESITVPTVALDEFCAIRQIRRPDVLKMDIQGHEIEAFRGAEQMLNSEQVALICTEVTFVPHYENGVLFNEVCAYLNDRGYTLFNMYDIQWARNGQMRFGDALFVSGKLRRSVIDNLPDEP